MEKCYSCGSDIEIIKNKPYRYDECGLNITLLGITQYYCKKCDEFYASIPNIQKLNRFIGTYICKNKKAILKPKEIKFLRKDIHLKVNELAQILGTPSSTIKKWEDEKKEIDEVYDRLLRSIYIIFTSHQSNHRLFDGVIEVFKELPAKRKIINQPGEILLNSQEWIRSPF